MCKVVISGSAEETDDAYVFPVRVFEPNGREISPEEFAEKWLKQ